MKIYLTIFFFNFLIFIHQMKINWPFLPFINLINWFYFFFSNQTPFDLTQVTTADAGKCLHQKTCRQSLKHNKATSLFHVYNTRARVLPGHHNDEILNDNAAHESLVNMALLDQDQTQIDPTSFWFRPIIKAFWYVSMEINLLQIMNKNKKDHLRQTLSLHDLLQGHFNIYTHGIKTLHRLKALS